VNEQCSSFIFKGFSELINKKAPLFSETSRNTQRHPVTSAKSRSLHSTESYRKGKCFASRNIIVFNPSNTELNPNCCTLALLGAHHIRHVSRIRVKEL
jgi:sialic acid synthase SpsE